MVWVVFCIYALMSAAGLFFIKTGSESTSFSYHDKLISFQLSPRLLLGFLLYICSFLLSVYVISKMKLSVFYPVGTGFVLVLTTLFGYFFLKERIGTQHLIGIALILAGVVVMNYKAA